MKRLPKAIVIAGLVVIVVMVLFPPYYGGKLPLEEGLHGNIGYFPLWDPPSVEYAYEVLHGEPYVPQVPGPNSAGPELSDKRTLDAYIVGLNKVRLIFNIIVVVILTSLSAAVTRKIADRRARTT